MAALRPFHLYSIFTMNQWLFAPEEAQLFPSIAKHRMSANEECWYRKLGCSFIQVVGCRLALPQLAIATAMVYFHRFFAVNSFKEHNIKHIATTCIFIASKGENAHRRLSDIINASVFVKFSGQDQNEVKKHTFGRWREAIVYNELVVLQSLCFDLAVIHPHEYLTYFGEMLGASTEIINTAWTIANDCMLSELCLMYPPEYIAVSCLLYALRAANVPISTEYLDNQLLRIFDEVDALTDIINHIAHLWTSPRPTENDQNKAHK
ncbi:hypothetical protein VTP01DRAFT_7411 [Rhizomucor pusillus]|uniref:uncharacterized protein n=1 Tax=Rhizomucor pusillus TaxID=4840 RepID=UPI003743A74B